MVFSILFLLMNDLYANLQTSIPRSIVSPAIIVFSGKVLCKICQTESRTIQGISVYYFSLLVFVIFAFNFPKLSTAISYELA